MERRIGWRIWRWMAERKVLMLVRFGRISRRDQIEVLSLVPES
jgi:hypothetical protein